MGDAIMKNKTRKLLSVLLALAMAFGLSALAPMTAHAAEEVCEITGGAQYASFKEAVDAAVNGQTIRMIMDYTETMPVEVDGKTIHLNLNGCALTLTLAPMRTRNLSLYLS